MTISDEQALQQIRHYCAYQERCHDEVNRKLWELGIKGPAAGEIIASLITDGFLNEERFARTYAGSKFRMKQWGRKKIKYALQQKRVSEYSIRKGLETIGEEEYRHTLEKLVRKKYASLKGTATLKKKQTLEYLIRKGFEPELIRTVTAQIITTK